MLTSRAPRRSPFLEAWIKIENGFGISGQVGEMNQDMNNSIDAAYEVEVFYDGGCPLCLREIKLLRHLDRKGSIRFTDIDSASFQGEAIGKSYKDLMAQMHGRLPDGKWVQGVEVFRRMYAAVGFRRLVAVSRLPLISQILQLGYWIFARNRLRLTGRCTAQTCLTERAAGTIH
jgi:predicted DCC family thiol-disulfide oxidoreductase YuxK